jgi:hypothetical protein
VESDLAVDVDVLVAGRPEVGEVFVLHREALDAELRDGGLMSGNISIREIFRYTQLNQDEIDQAVEDLF